MSLPQSTIKVAFKMQVIFFPLIRSPRLAVSLAVIIAITIASKNRKMTKFQSLYSFNKNLSRAGINSINIYYSIKHLIQSVRWADIQMILII